MNAYYCGLVMRAQKQITELVQQKFGEMQHAINVECDAKNIAYDFILENGLFDQYVEWRNRKATKGLTSGQTHGRAIQMLYKEACALEVREELRGGGNGSQSNTKTLVFVAFSQKCCATINYSVFSK